MRALLSRCSERQRESIIAATLPVAVAGWHRRADARAGAGLVLDLVHSLRPDLGAPWIGLQNYVNLPADERYIQAVRVTLLYVLLEVPLRLSFALLLAMVLNQGPRGLNVYRALYYLPSLFGGSVASPSSGATSSGWMASSTRCSACSA